MRAWRSTDGSPDAAAPGHRAPTPAPPQGSPLPGLAVVALATGVASLLARALGVTPLVVAVATGVALGNLGLLPARAAEGLRVASTTFLRAGVALLGLRLSLGDLAALGVTGVAAVVAGVAATFAGIRWLAHRIGVSPELGLLLATGYAVCGASAIAAVEGVTGADEEDVAFAVGLVTLFGSLSIVALPAVAGALGLEPSRFGAWSGAAVHDVGQVVATASTAGSPALAVAVVVKLCRVTLLAPLVTGLSLSRRRRSEERTTPRLLPAFVAGFLVAVAVRTTGLLPASVLSAGRQTEAMLLSAAMVALGCGVRLARLRRLGVRPIALGVSAWVVVAAVGLAVAHAVRPPV